MHNRFAYREGRFDNMSARSIERAKAFISEISPLQRYDCSICGGDDFEKISEVDRYGFYYPTGICRSCGNVQQYEYYSPDDISLLYSTYYRDIYGDKKPKDLFAQQTQSGRKIYEFVMEHADHPILTVLEIGTGAGGNLAAFHAHGLAVKGLDFDERYIAEGNSHGITIVRGGIESLAEDEKFDLIIMNHVVEHITDLKKLMSDVSRHLTENGFFYVEVPSIELIPIGFRGNLLIYYQNAHYIHFTRRSFANLLAITGYEMIGSSGAITALLRYTGKTGQIEADYAGSRAMIDDLERHYRTLGNRIPAMMRRTIRKSMEGLGMSKALDAWRGRNQ